MAGVSLSLVVLGSVRGAILATPTKNTKILPIVSRYWVFDSKLSTRFQEDSIG